jgi:xylulokinase
MGYLLGIDLGTSTIKADIYDTDGVLVGGSYREIKMLESNKNWKEQDPEVWWELLKLVLRDISIEKHFDLKKIIGIGICGQSHGPTPFNKNKKNLGPCITWMDQRCNKQVRFIEKVVGREKILSITSFDLDVAYTAAKILWIKENQPDIYKQTEKFLFPKDVLVLKLTGNYSTDITDASASNLFDVKKQEWSIEIFEELKISLDKFPEPNPPEKVVGETTYSIAQETGLQKGIPVIAGGADWATDFYGAGGIKPNLGIDMSGTVGVLAITIDKNFVGGKRLLTSIIPELKLLIVSGLQTAASLFQWGRDEFCLSEKYLSKRIDKNAFELMDEEIKKISPGSNGVFVYPHFEGQRYPGNPNLKGMIFGLSVNTKREEILRAILESVAYEYRKDLEGSQELKSIKCKKIMTSGGGSRSDVWNQIKADILGIPYYKSNILEAGTFGAAMLAGVGVGIYDNLIEPIEKFLKIKKIHNPIKKNRLKYDQYYKFYKNFTENINKMDLFNGYDKL